MLEVCITMILDIAAGVILLIFGIIGLVRGFARQVFSAFGKIVTLIGAFLLIKPIYTLCADLFINSFVEMLAGVFGNLTFLDSFASTVGKTTATLLAEYAVMLILFVVLVIVLGLLLKLVKKIIIAICDLPIIKFFDRLAGLILGLGWGLLLVFVIVYLWNFLMGWSVVPANVAEMLTKYYDLIAEGSIVVKPYLVDNFATIEAYFVEIWKFIKGGMQTVAAL